MKTILRTIVILCALTAAAAGRAEALAAAPAGAPPDSTGLCNDGSYYTGATKKGACKGHKGVKQWWGGKDSAQTKDATPTKDTKAAQPAAGQPAAAAPASAAAPAHAAKPAATAAAGGGPGKVWVNTQSKVYHCPGDQWYGKTKEGEYMAESDATAKGYRADHGKACK